MRVLEHFPRTARVIERFRTTPLQEEQPVYISRTVTMAPTPVGDIDAQLQAGIPLSEIAFTQTKLIRKSDKSKASAGLVMPIGGEADPTESVIQAGLRELGEETTLATFSETNIRSKSEEVAARSVFKYGIRGKKYKGRPRILRMFPVEVQSESVSPHMPREGENGKSDKIDGVVGFTPRQLRELIAQGEITIDGNTFYAADHFTTNEHPSADNPITQKPIIIDEQAIESRRQMLEGVLQDVDAFEQRMRRRTRMEINNLRKIKGGTPISDLSEAATDEIVTGFHAAQARMAFAEERAREVSGDQKPPPKADLLKIAPYLAALSPDKLPDFFGTVPTEEIGQTMHYLEGGLRAGVNAIINGLPDSAFANGDDQELAADLDQDHPDATFPHDISKEMIQELSPLEALQAVWPIYLKQTPVDRVQLIDAAEEATIQALASSGDNAEVGTIDPNRVEDINRAVRATHQFHKFITNDLRSKTSAEFDFFQEHDPVNEISNAGLFTHMAFALGLHPNLEIQPEAQADLKRLRFEAYRGLAVFTVAASRSETLRVADNKLFEASLDSFFQFPPTESPIDFGEGRQHTVYHRTTEVEVGGRQLEVLVDERAKKELLSATRKAFQDPNMNDVYSINFALADTNFVGERNTISDRLDTAIAFGDALVDHVQSELGGPDSGWTVSRIDRRRKSMDTARGLVTGETNGTLENAGGKRAGSAGDRIIREKFTVVIENEAQGKKQFVEVCIYPFESSHSEGVEQVAESGYWGFAEKLFDDREGNYNAGRTLSRSSSRPTEPSLYERLYPGHWFTNLSRKMNTSHVTPRKGAEPETSGGIAARLTAARARAKALLHGDQKAA